MFPINESKVELIRQREVLKYASYLLSNIVTQDHGAPDLSGSRTSSDDTTLTAFAQLCACQTGTSRCLISFFDQTYQYVVAEATPALPLIPRISHDGLLFCGIAFPRRFALCEHALMKPNEIRIEINDGVSHRDLPLLVVHDLTTDAHFGGLSKSCTTGDPSAPTRFYASVPIQTAKGVNIGVISVMCPREGTTWTDGHTEVLRNISGSIMSYLEGHRTNARSKSDHMSKAISEFMEENLNLVGNVLGPQVVGPLKMASSGDVARPVPAGGGARIPSRRAAIEPALSSSSSDAGDEGTPPSLVSDDSGMEAAPQAVDPPNLPSTSQPQKVSISDADPEVSRKSTIRSIFSNAARKMCQAMDVDGCLFLDTAPGGFVALKSHAKSPSGMSQSSASTSSDEGTDSSSGDKRGAQATELGFATYNNLGGDQSDHINCHAAVAAKLLASLVKRYPRGKLFHFGGNEDLNPTDSSEADLLSPVSETPAPREGGLGRQKRRLKPWLKQNEGRDILRMFPGARSVAFVPVWDPRKNRWFAGGFVYSRQPTCRFTVDGELSYLRVFCILAMTETMRHELALDEKAKFDALSSMSHELRSPLHGIILGIEMLNETDMNVTQGDMVHTLEACGRTLADTLDHLLDYAKINNFHATARTLPRGITKDTQRSIEAGMMAIRSSVKIDVLAEEVMDSIFAGFNFQYLSIAQLKKLDSAQEPDVAANLCLDSMRAKEELNLGSSTQAAHVAHVAFNDVMVLFHAAPGCDWVFDTQPGAIRRIVMNLFGNSLKYTDKGLIVLSLDQRSPKTGTGNNRERQVTITVSDTGRGISEDFLKHDLFKPFSQENPLTAGAGLGLSLVKRITSQLHGRMSVQSRVGLGTTISVTLPLSIPAESTAEQTRRSEEDPFQTQLHQLSGLRICVLGFGPLCTLVSGEHHSANATIGDMCHDWLGLEVVANSDDRNAVPDFVLVSEDAFLERSRDSTLSKLPCVVVCVNVLVAHQLSSQAKEYKDTVEFIYQPVGPRKLAKVLSLAFSKWAAVNADCLSHEIESPANAIAQESGMSTGEQESLAKPLPPPSIPRSTSSGSDDSGINMETNLPQKVPIRPKLVRSVTSTGKVSIEVLLVEDNPINLRILCAIIKKLGLRYHTATNGQEAVEAYKRKPSQCKYILTDVSMPIMDGFEATRQIRKHERAKGLAAATIIALTGLASSDSQKEAFKSGMDLFLTKPVKYKELGAILMSRGLIR